MVIEVTGKIEFEPENVTRKHHKQSEWKRVAMIRVNCDIHLYYAWFLKKRFNLELNRPLRGAHVTIISDRVDDKILFDKAAKHFNGKKVKFYIDPEPRTNGEHWWLRAYCPDAETIREICGLRKEPFFSFHLTLGYANEKNIAHSMYILDQCKRFEIISSGQRKKLEDHEIVNFKTSTL